MNLSKTFDMSGMFLFDNLNRSVSFRDSNIDISSSTTKHFNVHRDLNVLNSNVNISGGLNISGDVVLNGIFNANNLEVNAMLTASGGFFEDLDCRLIDATTFTSTNSNIANLVATDMTFRNNLNADNFTTANFYDISFTNRMEGVIGSKLNAFEFEGRDCKVTNILEITNDTSAVHLTSQDVSVNNNLDVSGTVDCDLLKGRGVTPVGGIIFWNGSSLDIPYNWNICIGTNNTPDLKHLMSLDPSQNILH